MEKQHLRDLLEIKTTIESHIKRLVISGFPKEEMEYRKQELTMLLRKVNKIRKARQKPIESIETVRGISFKIGDTFHIFGDTVSTYTIVLFPDSLTIRGEAHNPAIGKPWTCEVYVESAQKVTKKKPKRIKPEKKVKVKIKVGEYFALRTNNTIYKVNTVKKKKVYGTNDLKKGNRIGTFKTEIILKTKKEYNKQHKAKRK